MSHVIGLDLEDLSKSQLRRLLRHSIVNSIPKGKRPKPEADTEEDEDDEENDDLVDLHREKGDSKPPKVTKDDLPKGAEITDEE